MSTKNFSHPYLDHLHPNPEAHRTYSNLANLENQSILYHKEEINSPVAHYRTTIKASRDNAEPIYENVPLPWREDKELRSRTSSIQSAPEVITSKQTNESNTINDKNVEADTRQKNNINNSIGSQSPQTNQSITLHLNPSANTSATSDLSRTDTSLYSTGIKIYLC